MSADSVLETLFLPLADQHLRWPAQGGALFLRARDGWPLHSRALSGLVCSSLFKPDVDALQRSGLTISAEDAAQTYPLILLLPPRQRDEARALFARALARLTPGGILLACQANSEGAKSGEADLRRLAGPLQVLSKHKCRVYWTRPDAKIDGTLQAQWRELDKPRPIAGGEFLSRPGVFAWDRVDVASQLLATHLPADLHGRAADLGCGWGYLAAQLLQRCPGVDSVDLYEANLRALALAKRNLARFGARLGASRWHDVSLGLGQDYDVIVSNPPFHTQQAIERPDLGRRFIAAAASALLPGGRLWLVANRHLPYEAALEEGFVQRRVVTQQQGFKVIEAVRATLPARR